MEYRRAIQYYEMITVIEAQDYLMQMQLADYPNMKTAARKRLHREFHKKAYPESYQSEKTYSLKDAARWLSGKLSRSG